jgi:excisionase family DNA binding protein
VTSQADETEIPALDQYIPFLQRQPEVAEITPKPLAAEPEPHVKPEILETEEFLHTTIPMAAPLQQDNVVETLPEKGEPEYESAAARPRPIRAAATAEPAPPIPPERLWNLVPKHLQVLLAIESDDVTQNSYKRQFKESRIELISRLLDPTLSLEDTARLLSVCPTTVRRYTNKGLLTHQRTQGDQRRFKLSDVLAFLETQSRKAM